MQIIVALLSGVMIGAGLTLFITELLRPRKLDLGASISPGVRAADMPHEGIIRSGGRSSNEFSEVDKGLSADERMFRNRLRLIAVTDSLAAGSAQLRSSEPRKRGFFKRRRGI